MKVEGEKNEEIVRDFWEYGRIECGRWNGLMVEWMG